MTNKTMTTINMVATVVNTIAAITETLAVFGPAATPATVYMAIFFTLFATVGWLSLYLDYQIVTRGVNGKSN